MAASSRGRNLPLITAAVLLLAGCASSGPQLGGNRRYPIGQPHYTVAPYQVNGVWYYPRVDYNYAESGTASWYGPGFDQRPTADGEIYDMNQLSAAHKTLPLPSVVEITNLQNGRALQLRVNDRGPFIGDRLIDVSRRAAQLLGFERSGTAPVEVRILKDQSIEVAEAAMLGEFGPVGVAGAPQAARIQLAAAAPQARPASLRATEVIAAPLPREPAAPPAAAPPQPARAAPPAAVAAPFAPPPVAAAQRRYWPSLIASAHAEALDPRIAAVPPRARPARARRSGPALTSIRETSAPAGGRSGTARIFVQAGAFAVPENARRVRARIAALGAAEIVPARINGAAMYRVRLGPLTSEAAARRLLGEVVGRGYPGARLVGE